MKLLLVHPNVSPGDELVRSLQSSGAVVLIAQTPEQARQMLEAHATTLEAAIIHREPWGMSLLPFIRTTASLSDLPYVLTSSEWTDDDFIKHQDGPEGANAYLRFESCERDLRFVLEQVLGRELSMSLESPAERTAIAQVSDLALPRQAEAASPTATLGSSQAFDVRIEDATSVFQAPLAASESSFRLEVDQAVELALMAAPTLQPSSDIPFAPLELGTAGSSPSELKPAAPSIAPFDFGAPVAASEPMEISAGSWSGAAGPSESSLSGLSLVASGEISPPPISEPAPPRREVTAEAISDPVAELPYLFGGAARPRPSMVVGDAVVPGGAAQSPDTETLKRYLVLREQDVATLSAQLHEARTQIRKLEDDLRQSHALMEEQEFQLEGKSKREQEFEREKALLTEGLQAEMDELRFQMKARSDKARALESQVRETSQEMERLRERVRHDMRKIRVREKELENRLEIVKTDSEAILRARESTILELKRKLDTAEFNLDLMHDRLGREKDQSADLREKLLRASQAVRLAGGLLDPVDSDAGPETAGRSSERPDRKIS